jgi:hypothetical protein
MSKSEKSAYFRYVFVNNFFHTEIFSTFLNSAFFDTHITHLVKCTKQEQRSVKGQK